MNIPLSILDLAPISKGQNVGDAIAGSVALARQAETFGYRRVWYAEHHNMASIASRNSSGVFTTRSAESMISAYFFS